MKHPLVAAGLVAGLVLGTAGTAQAGDGRLGSKPGGVDTSKQPDQSPGSISATVKFTKSYNGEGSTMTSSDSSWSPPVCWYVPKFTSDQYEKYVNGHYVSADNAFADIAEDMNKVDYNRDKKGKFWQIEYADDNGDAMLNCPLHEDVIWVDEGDPDPPEGVPDPEMLARMAYAQTKLPAPPIKLSPAADSQKVNLATWASFSAPLDRVYVTARLNGGGIDVAATTVATPTALTIDAGTDDADPKSCTYDLAKSGGTYKVNTRDADCNITYRRASGDDTYPLHAQVTWKVHWTASADPDGPAQQPGLPDGLSTADQDVTVKEIQAVNRD